MIRKYYKWTGIALWCNTYHLEYRGKHALLAKANK